jgi:DNA-binding CsgD family transcriptional regulator
MSAKLQHAEEASQDITVTQETDRKQVTFEIDRIRYLVIPQADLPRAVAAGCPIDASRCAGMIMIENVPYIVIKDISASCNGRDPAELLTGRELQIAHLVALGHCTKRIADILHISEWTVSTHLRRVFAKLNVDSRAAMVYRCGALLDRSVDTGYDAEAGHPG